MLKYCLRSLQTVNTAKKPKTLRECVRSPLNWENGQKACKTMKTAKKAEKHSENA